MEGKNLTSAFKSILSRIRNNPATEEDQHDALQEAFCRLWCKRSSLSDSGNTESLISITANNIRKDDYRKKSRHPELDLDEVSDFAEERDDSFLDTYSRVLKMADAVLSQRDREILFLRDRDEWEFEDIADRYGISETNVRVIVSRARKTVRDLWNNKK